MIGQGLKLIKGKRKYISELSDNKKLMKAHERHPAKRKHMGAKEGCLE